MAATGRAGHQASHTLPANQLSCDQPRTVKLVLGLNSVRSNVVHCMFAM